jgi:hypothetical protein
MVMENDMALSEINAFIDQNKENLRRVKSENPSLYGVVADTLAFLNKKFGGEEAPPIVMPEIEEEPKVELPQTEELPKIEVGDKFSSPNALNSIYEISIINNDDVLVYISDIDTGKSRSWGTNKMYLQGEIKLGNLVKIESNEKLLFEVGDLFFIVGFPKDVYAITDISQGKVNYKRIPRSNALTETMKIDDFKGIIDNNDVIFLPKANELTFEVGDLLINQTGDATRVDYVDFNSNSVILVTQKGTINVSQKTMYLTDVVDRINEGTLKVQKVGSFQSTPAPQPSPYYFKVGDKFRKSNDTSTPPNVIYTIKNINSDWDSITYDIYSKLSGTTQEYGDSIRDFQEELDNGEIVQYIPQLPLIPPSANNYSFKEGDNLYYVANPKIIYTVQSINKNGDVEVTENDGTEWTWDANTLEEEIDDGFLMLGMPPVAGQAPAQMTLQEQINELKDAIDGFQILADIGDEDAIQEIKKLKKELKTLKASNK